MYIVEYTSTVDAQTYCWAISMSPTSSPCHPIQSILLVFPHRLFRKQEDFDLRYSMECCIPSELGIQYILYKTWNIKPNISFILSDNPFAINAYALLLLNFQFNIFSTVFFFFSAYYSRRYGCCPSWICFHIKFPQILMKISMCI